MAFSTDDTYINKNQDLHDISETFFFAARFGDLKTIQKLPLSLIDLFQQDENGNTALHMASANGHLNIVQFLLSQLPETNDKHKYISIQNERGNTPLHWASVNGHLEIVSELVKGGANLHIQNDAQKTPLSDAEFHGRKNVVMWFLTQTDMVPVDPTDSLDEL
ncbi:unnamed protein product [Pneumocystis jirovecii]|uniref:Ankyrin repeat-containing protein YAR1 n=2 Tax=Pneumocystis jirovecii TaxID=42068 RepID=L0P8Q3_PNEJI|nr:uncharacterized protein T551_00107 [Pneumocystis jirovecii RU7]KTW32622.1 hypothetical protein T551_00107 [Pneumocystis jirovecii RU7]CCJ28454.1 unnamed protein product [Pneumocystis jirovecii]CCJ28518.1 unnamed protein product [Pneumocystis jirovecii]